MSCETCYGQGRYPCDRATCFETQWRMFENGKWIGTTKRITDQPGVRYIANTHTHRCNCAAAKPAGKEISS